MNIKFPNGLNRALTLSYDDGVIQDKRFMDIIDGYGIKATFNINTEMFSQKTKRGGRHSLEQALEIYEKNGHEVALHGAAHAFPNRVPSNIMLREVCDDRTNLEEIFQKPVRGMAYAYGKYTKETLDVLKLCKIAYSRTTKSTHSFDLFHGDEWLELNPTCHHKEELDELCEKFFELKAPDGKMFYLWGHTYEFDANDNWYIIENFAKKMGGREDIWYANNIQIHDYVEAFDRLIVSMDASFVTNPNAIPVWFSVTTASDSAISDEKMFVVNPGETIKLK